nr:glycosyltransferase family 39 protein [uncultured Desulfobulbus sp.]
MVQFVQRVFVSPTLSVDEAEQFILSQSFSFGYNEQPPLYTWLQIVSMYLFGSTVVALSFLKNSILCITFIFYFKLAKIVSHSEVKAIVATLGLYLVPQIFWEAKVDQTHSVIVTMASVLALYSFMQIFRGHTSLFRFLLLGIVCGLGVLSKYNFVLLLFAAICPLFVLTEFRKNFCNKKLYFSILSFLLIILPHTLWFLGHITDGTKSTVERMHQQGVLNVFSGAMGGISNLVISSATFTVLLLAVWIIFFRKGFRIKIDSQDKKYFSIFFVATYSLLFCIIIFLGVSSIKERWLMPYLVFFPLYLTLFTASDMLQEKIKVLVGLCAAIAVFSGGLYVLGPRLIDVTRHASRIQTPFVKLKSQLDQVVQSADEPQLYAVDYFIGGNIRHFFPERVVSTKEKELEADQHSNLLLFYEKRVPRSLLNKLERWNYECTTSEMRATYLYSDEIQYTLKYLQCRKA